MRSNWSHVHENNQAWVSQITDTCSWIITTFFTLQLNRKLNTTVSRARCHLTPPRHSTILKIIPVPSSRKFISRLLQSSKLKNPNPLSKALNSYNCLFYGQFFAFLTATHRNFHTAAILHNISPARSSDKFPARTHPRREPNTQDAWWMSLNILQQCYLPPVEPSAHLLCCVSAEIIVIIRERISRFNAFCEKFKHFKTFWYL